MGAPQVQTPEQAPPSSLVRISAIADAGFSVIADGVSA
jgi:hypothetical protein